MKRRHGMGGLAVLLAGTAACGRSPATQAAVDVTPPMPVRTAKVVRSARRGEAALPGTVAARERAALAARVPGAVVELPYREGQTVAAGAVVVRLDDRALRSALEAAETASRVAAADAGRLETLLAKGAATPQESEAAGARATAARAAVAAADDALSYAVLRAPFDGVIGARRVDVGDVVLPGTVLVELQGRGGLEVRATVDAATAGTLRPGQRVEADVDGQPQRLEAVVRALSPAGDPASHRFEVRAELPRGDGLRSGVFARLLVAAPEAEQRLLVPDEALIQRGGLTGVYVVADGQARLRWIAVGHSAGGLTEVRAGVEAGEEVALDTTALHDGSRVEARP